MPPVSKRVIAGGRLRRYQQSVVRIGAYGPELEAHSDHELRQRAADLKARLRDGLAISDGVVECFALAREAARRTLGLCPYDVQVLGGLLLAEGKVTEMKTGEGKTLTATLPATLYGMVGRGAHVVTVNDYLARRDADWMGSVYDLLGVSVGVLQEGQSTEEKRRAYACDITYGTNHEFGFDYLRDNMAKSREEQVSRGRFFALVDEVDNILIDEARTPLIIAGPAPHNPQLYATFAQVAERLTPGEPPKQQKASGVQVLSGSRKVHVADYDYEVHEKDKRVSVTERGVARVEEMLRIPNLYTAENGHLVNCLVQALRAKACFQREVDYTVVDGEVTIIDKFTGRLAEGRSWTDGLHQAVEAKEGLSGDGGNTTLASITYQNFFRLYEHLAGMTGTIMTEATEMRSIYGLECVEVPTHRPLIRIDHPDQMFPTRQGKFTAAVRAVKARHERGQPVLLGTTTVETSEHLSRLLDEAGIPHRVLNAKPEQVAQEAHIVAQAGRPGAVTIATNMAGRGTDIRLGGDPMKLARDRLAAEGATEADQPEGFRELVAECELQAEREGAQAREAGGLFVLATDRHDSRRIDNQLRGRSGRQGDPGESLFMCSAEDNLVRMFAGDKLHRLLTGLAKLDAAGNELPLTVKALAKQVEKAQQMVEERHYRERKRVLDYDDVLSKQREVIYAYREALLDGEDLTDRIHDAFGRVAGRVIAELSPTGFPEDRDVNLMHDRLQDLFAVSRWFGDEPWLTADPITLSDEELGAEIEDMAVEALGRFRAGLGTEDPEVYGFLTRHMLLSVIDNRWQEHLADMEYLREGVGLRSLAQLDPLVAYKNEGYTLFEDTVESIWEDFCRVLFHANVTVTPPSEQEPA